MALDQRGPLREHRRVPGFRPLYVRDDGRIYAARGNTVWVSQDAAATFSPVARWEPARWERLATGSRLLRRLVRGGFHDLHVGSNGVMIGVVRGAIVRAEHGAESFSTVLRIPRGSRPLGVTSTPDGFLCFGEYFSNAERSEVHVYGSDDGGSTWEVVHTFAAGAIRHVHRIVHDPYRNGLVVLTGDEDDECRVLFTPDRFGSLTEWLRGGQQARAVSAIPVPEGLILPTDTPLQSNHIHLLDTNGKLRRLASIPGSSFSACAVRSSQPGARATYFVSTGVEPSRVNRERHATIFSSEDGDTWVEVYRGRKDFWPAKLLQYGNVWFPSGDNHSGFLYAHTVAISGDDGALHRWRVASS